MEFEQKKVSFRGYPANTVGPRSSWNFLHSLHVVKTQILSILGVIGPAVWTGQPRKYLSRFSSEKFLLLVSFEAIFFSARHMWYRFQAFKYGSQCWILWWMETHRNEQKLWRSINHMISIQSEPCSNLYCTHSKIDFIF